MVAKQSQRDKRVKQQISAWRDELINLTRRNALLYYKPTRSSTLEIESPDVSSVLNRLLRTGKASVWEFYSPPQQPDDELEDERPALERKPLRDTELLTQKKDSASLNNTLRNLERRTNQEYLDKGLWVLYLGAGLLEWQDPDTQEAVRSPLVLYPVVISRENPRSPYRLRLGEDDIVTNPALLLKFESDYGIQLPRFEDSAGLSEYLAAVGDTKELSRRGWSVSTDAVIRTFSFHKEVMYRDLQANEEAVASHAVIRSLALGPDSDADLSFEPTSESDLDDVFPPETLTAILDADATQRRCLAAAASGQSFVMDGPPGTGKSQTIANLIASSIEEGKTVLFVSEKAAALDVVSSRLRESGLGEYLLELHSHKATRKQFAYIMADALKQQPVAPKSMSTQSLEEAVSARTLLSGYALAMNRSRQPLDRSLHEVLGRLSQLNDAPQVPIPNVDLRHLGAGSFAAAMEAANRIARAWGPVERREDFVWAETIVDGSKMSEIQSVANQLRSAIDNLVAMRGEAASVADELGLTAPSATSDAEDLHNLLGLIQTRPEMVPQSWLATGSLQDVMERRASLADECGGHKEAVKRIREVAGSSWRGVEPAASEALEKFLGRVDNARDISPISRAWGGRDLLLLKSTIDHAIEILESVGRQGQHLSETFDASTSERSIDDGSRLAELALLVGSTPAPDGLWLDELALNRAESSAGVLRESVAEFLASRETLESTFTDEVLDLDLQGIIARYQDVHRGVRKLSSSYRADKRLVGAATRTGKASKESVARLPEALEWQRQRDELRKLENVHASVVGEIYYHSEETDWSVLAEALELCGVILQSADQRVDVSALRRHFSVQGHPESRTRALGEEYIASRNELINTLQDSPATLRLGSESRVLSTWLGTVRDDLDRVIDVVLQVDRIAGQELSLREVEDVTQWRRTIDVLESAIAEAEERDALLFGDVYSGLETDLGALDAAIDWATDVREALDGACPSETARAIIDTELSGGAIADELAAAQTSFTTVAGLFGDGRSDHVLELLRGEFDLSAAYLQRLSGSLDDIDEWQAFATARDELSGLGLGESAAFCIDSGAEAAVVASAIERALLVGWSDAVMKAEGNLSPRRRKDRDALVKEFAQLDEDLKQHAVASVIHACNARRPTNVSAGPAALIVREGNKKTRHRPIRSLMADAREVIQSLKPCFMMSPMTVSQYLDPDTRFDVVIFDEASQVLPADAINCIYRGTQIIIAGDQKQLPPTSFFQRMDDLDESAEYDEDELDKFESILDIAKGSGMMSLPLQWHYRSQHESLIAFSNFSFYNGELVTYPGATDSAQHVGVELYRVDGTYRRGTSRDNPVEASKVAERVLFHAQEHPELTVGVVAFSEAQASLIENVVERMRVDHPELDEYFTEDRLSGFFVKNLESVQGDERDIMIFSVGYGPDELGVPVKGNFGPLTKPGGERRLNVAITRARQRVEVISSIGAGDFKSSWTSAGARHLKRYLDYADRGIAALALDLKDSEGEPESPFEESVIDVIRSWGYDAVPQVGTAGYRIDIGVRHPQLPGKFAIGIECDGAMYHSSRVARDRDRLRQEVLERLGWNIYRIWGTSWYRTRDAEERALKKAIEEAVNGHPQQGRPDPEPAVKVSVADVDYERGPTWVVPYEITTISVPTKWRMTDPSAQPALRDAIDRIVKTEAPVHEDIVLTRIREAWGAGRAGRLIRESFHKQVQILKRKGRVKTYRTKFLWVHGETKNLEVRVPVMGNLDTMRRVEHVAPEELRLAMLGLITDTLGAELDELTVLTARLFGWMRRSKDISATLEAVAESLVESGDVRWDGARLRAASG